MTDKISTVLFGIPSDEQFELDGNMLPAATRNWIQPWVDGFPLFLNIQIKYMMDI